MYVQVLSESVGHALTLFGGPEKAETAKFASMFDKFFDSLNSRNCVTAKQKRKVFLRPYFSGEDFRVNVSGIGYDCSYNTYNVKASVSEREKKDSRFIHVRILQWLQEDFLGYLAEWKASVSEREKEGFTKSELDMMCLSKETLEGLQMTGT